MVERLISFFSPTESSKQQKVVRTWGALHAGLHTSTLSGLEIFQVGRALPSIID